MIRVWEESYDNQLGMVRREVIGTSNLEGLVSVSPTKDTGGPGSK